jgi:hypothetical protein
VQRSSSRESSQDFFSAQRLEARLASDALFTGRRSAAAVSISCCDESNLDMAACSQFGCPANGRLPKFASKLAWADQQCPLGKWPKLV